MFVEVSAADAARMLDLSQEEQYVFNIIKNAADVGLWTREIKRYSKINAQSEITNILKSLLQKKLVKQVKDIQNKTQKKYMLFDCEPSDKMTGGPWYTDAGEFDQEFYHETEKLVLKTLDYLRKKGKV
jgi:DNA-directed RNA polymerase III subunit RPC6